MRLAMRGESITATVTPSVTLHGSVPAVAIHHDDRAEGVGHDD
jgi:hypothetical protein